VKLAGKILLSLGIILFELNNKLRHNSDFKHAVESKDQDLIDAIQGSFDSSAIVKIITTFSQMITIILTLDFTWSTELL